MKRVPQTESMMDMNQLRAFLRSRGINKQMFDAIRFNMLRDSMREQHDIKFDRYMTAFGMALRQEFKFGGERIVRALQAATDLIFQCTEEADWIRLFHELRDETGVVVVSEKEIRFFKDYIGSDTEEAE